MVEQHPYSRKFEDYLEAILAIVSEKGHARTKDVAASLDVTPASVAEMFRRLHDEGLVVHKKYEGVKLTRKGKEVAKAVQRHHTIIRTFLEIIGVPSTVADDDACIMEHHLHPVTIEKLSTFVRFIETAPESPFWLEHYKIYEETGLHRCENEKE